MRDACDVLRAHHPDAQAGELWKQPGKQVGPKVIPEAWHNLATTDAWQDFYVKNQRFLAAEEFSARTAESKSASDRRDELIAPTRTSRA